MAEYFTFREMLESETAKDYGISNIPNSLDIFRNLNFLMCNLLDPLRREMKMPIFVTSGYRSPLLNRILRGVANSQHVAGEAADIKCNLRNDTLKLWQLIKLGDYEFDQAILYTKRNFIHLSLKRNGMNRKEILYNDAL